MLGPNSTAATRYRRAAGFFGAAYAALIALVALGWVRPLDLSLAAVAYFGLPCWALSVSDAASLLLAGEVSLLYAAALALLCTWRGRPLLGLWLAGVMLATVPVEFLFKFSLHQPAPSALLGTLERPECGRLAYPLTSVSAPNTLPSGYAVRAAYFGLLSAALVGARWPRLAKPARWALMLVLALLGVTRVAIAWHWPSDVLAGLLLGAAAACLALAPADGLRWLGPPTATAGRAPHRR